MYRSPYEPEDAVPDSQEAGEGTPPIYDGQSRLLDWNHSGSRGMTVDLRLVYPGRDGMHPFKLIPYGQQTGQRLRVVTRLPSGAADVPGPVIHEGEALLLDWSETGHRGMMVRFLLDDGPDGVTGRNPFFGFEIGKNTGEPIELVVHALADDETLVDPKSVRRKVPFHQMTAVQQANIIGTKPDFVRFLVDNIQSLIEDDALRASLMQLRDRPKAFSDAVVRAFLGVSSRSIMNQESPIAANARMRWLRLLTLYENETYGIRR
jgi:hypothetical protein